MKKNYILIILFLCTFASSAQIVQQIVEKPMPEAIKDIELLVKNEITDSVRIVGIGDLGALVKETQVFNTSLTAYLINNRGFRNVILMEDEWQIRPLNSYLTGKLPLDTTVLDALIANCISRSELSTTIVRSFLIWMKNYNLLHSGSVVNLYGAGSSMTIPSSYFLAAYVFPLDKAMGLKMGKKWDDQLYSEAQSFQDIEDWYAKISESPFSKQQKEIAERCRQDIVHNKNIFKVDSMTQRFAVEAIQNQFNYIHGSILARTDRKSILFMESRMVVRSDYISNFTSDNIPMASLGKLLSEKWKSKYYVVVPDFGNSLRSPIVDLSTQKINVETFSPSEKIKQLFSKKDYYFTRTDAKALAGFLPVTIPFIKGHGPKLVYDKEIAPFDALFIFNDLTEDSYTAQ